MQNQMLDLDEVVRRVSLEAKQLKLQDTPKVEPKSVSGEPELPLPTLANANVFSVKSRYHIHDFLKFQDVEFVKNAFRGVLQRRVDGTGLETYLAFIRNRGGRRAMIADLLLSEEGRKANVKIDGFALYLFLHKNIRKLPASRLLIGPINRVLEYLAVAGKRAADLDKIERQLVDNQTQLVEKLKQALLESHARMSNMEAQVAELVAESSEIKKENALVRQDLRYQQRSVAVLLEQLTSSDDARVLALQEAYQEIPLDAYYVAFEDACRGTRETIRLAQMEYLPVLGSPSDYSSKKLVDLGCGRGEWLQLVGEYQWEGYGVDMNKLMVQQCQQDGLNAIESDALSYLKSLSDNSIAIITGFHIIEHLPFGVLFNVFAEAMRVLVPGGRIVFETPNPENLLVASHTFYHDPTHRNPITPTSIKFLASYNGFVDIDILRLHPYPEEAKVKGIDPLTERVNGHLCGPQDFAICAVKPKALEP